MRWWLAELFALLPGPLRNFLHSQKRLPLLIRLANFQVFFFSIENGQEKPLAHFYLHDEGSYQCDRFFQENPIWQRAEKIVLLNSKQALRRYLALPVAAHENLARVLAYEIDRYMPYKAEQLHFVGRLIGKNKEATQINVELVCVAKERLNHYCQELQSWGLAIDAVIYDDVVSPIRGGINRYDYNLLPEALRTPRARAPEIATWFFAGCFAMLALSAAVLPFWWQANRLDDLQQQVAIAQKKAEEVESLKSQADAMQAVANKIQAIKAHSPSILIILKQLTDLLPKDTWIKSFEYVDNKVSLQGLTASSSALIGLLEASPHFKETSFTSPVTQDSQAGLDRFQLDTHIEDRR